MPTISPDDDDRDISSPAVPAFASEEERQAFRNAMLDEWEYLAKSGEPRPAGKSARFSADEDGPDAGDVGPVVEFSETDPAEDADGFVTRRGKIFEFGYYPDKKFGLTAAEFEAANADLGEVPIDLEHVPTVLDGQMGGLESATVLGNELHGTARLPKWLDKLLSAPGEDGKPRPLKVSPRFNRETKRLEKLSLVRNPRVTDAALFAAFSAADADGRPATWHGRDKIQAIHDMAASGGARCDLDCDDDGKAAQFTLKHEAAGLQKIHDHAVKAGAECRTHKRGSGAMFSAAARPRSILQLLAVAAGARRLAGKADPKGLPMTLRDKVIKLFTGKGGDADSVVFSDEEAAEIVEKLGIDGEPLPAPAQFSTGRFSVDDDPTVKALRDQVAALEKAREDDRKEAVARDAAVFATDLTKAGKLVPSVAPAVLALFSALADDDHAGAASVNFSAGGKDVSQPRLDTFKAILQAAPSHGYFREEVAGRQRDDPAPGEPAVFSAPNPDAPPSLKRLEELLNKTPEGRAALARKAGK